MTFTVSNTNAFARQNGIKFLVYGKPDTGKTFLISTLPKPLAIVSEQGLFTLKKFSIPYVTVDSIQGVNDLITWLTVDNHKNIAPYESIAFDGISFLTHQILSEARKTITTKEPRQYYAKLSEVVMPLVECLVNLPKHVYITAWEGEEIHPLTQKTIAITPSIAGSAVGKYLRHFFDQTLHLARHSIDTPQADGTIAKVSVPYLQTRDLNNLVFARDRTQSLEPFEPADIGAIITKLINAQTA